MKKLILLLLATLMSGIAFAQEIPITKDEIAPFLGKWKGQWETVMAGSTSYRDLELIIKEDAGRSWSPTKWEFGAIMVQALVSTRPTSRREME